MRTLAAIFAGALGATVLLLVAIARRGAPAPTIHFNDGSAHDRAMAWSAGYSEGFDAAFADPRTAELATGGGQEGATK